MLKTLSAETDMESLLAHAQSYRWVSGLAGSYIFYLHDEAVHAGFDALEKRLDEVWRGSGITGLGVPRAGLPKITAGLVDPFEIEGPLPRDALTPH